MFVYGHRPWESCTTGVGSTINRGSFVRCIINNKANDDFITRPKARKKNRRVVLPNLDSNNLM